jgi:hypothetical protein
VTWWTWPGLRGAVLEHIPGRLEDIGAGGCSVATSSPLATGTFGFVEIEGADASLAEVARVCAVTERPGAASPFLLRLEFLPIALPLPASANEDTTGTPGHSLVGAGVKAGSSLTLVRRHEVEDEPATERTAQDAPEQHGNAASGHPGWPLADALRK